MWEKIKAAFKHSVTILVARLMSVAGLVLVFLSHLAADPSISSAVQNVLKPEYVPYYIIAAGIVVELARRRTTE